MRSTGWEAACWAPAGAGASRRASGPAGSVGASSGLTIRPIRPRTAGRRAVPGPRRRGDEGRGIAMGTGRGTSAEARQTPCSHRMGLPILGCGRCGRPRRPTNGADPDHRLRLLSWLNTTDQLTVDRSGRIKILRYSSRCRLPTLPQLCSPMQPPNRQEYNGSCPSLATYRGICYGEHRHSHCRGLTLPSPGCQEQVCIAEIHWWRRRCIILLYFLQTRLKAIDIEKAALIVACAHITVDLRQLLANSC